MNVTITPGKLSGRITPPTSKSQGHRLLLAAALYFRSSPRLYDWLLAHPHLGTYIRNFRENRAIPLRVKIVSVSLVWLTLGN